MSDEKKLEKGTSGDDKVLRMGTASIPRLITEFAIPSVVGMLINGSYAIIDSVFLGHAVGEIGLSAMTVANPIMIVFMAIAMLIGNGGNALAALRLGEGKRDEAERALGNVVSLSLVAAVIVLVIGWNPALVSWVLDLASATPEVRPYAQTFIQILCAGFILQCIGLGVNNFIRTCGAPNRALGTMVIGLVGSVAFNALFVLALGWGGHGQRPGHGARLGLLVFGGAPVLLPAQRRSHAAALARHAPELFHGSHHSRLRSAELLRAGGHGHRELRHQLPAGALRGGNAHRR